MLKNVAMRLPLFRSIENMRIEMREEMDLIKSRMDIPDELFERFQGERSSAAYRAVFDLPQPLVSVCVSTYNRGRLLVGRCIKSLLAQDYTNIEVVVVGDCCTDDTPELLAQIRDKRLRFVNLPQRGVYPENSDWRWMVAGTTAVNHALTLARGDFITHLDDDDEHSPDRIGKLLKLIRETRADIVWHPFWHEMRPGKWALNRAEKFRHAQVSTSSVFYHKWLRNIPWDAKAYFYREPGDWNRFRKFRYLGVKAVRHPEALLRHYKERNQLQR